MIDTADNPHAVVEETYGSSLVACSTKMSTTIDEAYDIHPFLELVVDQSDQLHATYLKHQRDDRSHTALVLPLDCPPVPVRLGQELVRRLQVGDSPGGPVVLQVLAGPEAHQP